MRILEEKLSGFLDAIFAREVLAVGVGQCFYGFSIKSSYYGPYLLVALQN